MAATAQELASQMIQQLRLLDPSVSAEVGTPERKILDTVSDALAGAQIDLVGLRGSLDLDGKFGSNLDRFLALFGFARIKATYSTGYVKFSRNVASTSDIRIPANTQVQSIATDSSSTQIFFTSQTVTLSAGSTEVIAPIRAALAGAQGNVPANSITQPTGQTIIGITSINNELPTTGGIDSEDDDAYKIRFKNTIFRNLAGTIDQYLALSVATAFTTKVNVIGPQSKYLEYIQVPPVDDTGSYDYSGDGDSESGNGLAGEYTTALSTNPFIKNVYLNYPIYISNGDFGPASFFYRDGVDFSFNTSPSLRDRGDAHRASVENVGLDPSSDTVLSPNVTFKNVYTGAVTDVKSIRPNDVVLLEYTYISEASRNNLEHNITNAVDVYIDGGNERLASTVTSAPDSSTAFVDNPNSPYHYENYRRIGEPLKRPIIGNMLTPLFWQPVLSLPPQIVIESDTYLLGEHYWLVEDISDIGGTIRGRSGIEWNANLKGKLTADPETEYPEPPAYEGELIVNQTDPLEIENFSYDRNILDLQGSLEGSKQITTDILAHSSRRRFFKFDITLMYSPGFNAVEVNNQISFEVDAWLQRQYYGSTIQLSDVLQIIHNVPGVDNVRWSSDVPNVNPSFGPNAAYASPRVIECDVNGRPLNSIDIERVVLGSSILTLPEDQWLFITGDPMTEANARAIAGTNSGLHSRFKLIHGGNSTGWVWYTDTTGSDSTGSSNVDPALDTRSMAKMIKDALGSATPSGITLASVVEDTRSTTDVNIKARSFRLRFNTNAPQGLIQVTENQLFGGPTMFRNDFFIRDNEVAALPLTTFNSIEGKSDTVPGFIIRPRAQGTWTRST